MILPNFNSILFVDIETACWNHSPPHGMRNEIIEIGITSMDNTDYSLTNSNNWLVKPKHATISKFCTKFTGIGQDTIDKFGRPMNEVLSLIINEFHPMKKVWYSWGKYDKIQLNRMCKYNNLKNPFPDDKHLDAQLIVSSLLNTEKSISLIKAAELLNLDYNTENFHNAGFDSVCLAKIMASVYKNFKQRKT